MKTNKEQRDEIRSRHPEVDEEEGYSPEEVCDLCDDVDELQTELAQANAAYAETVRYLRVAEESRDIHYRDKLKLVQKLAAAEQQIALMGQGWHVSTVPTMFYETTGYQADKDEVYLTVSGEMLLQDDETTLFPTKEAAWEAIRAYVEERGK